MKRTLTDFFCKPPKATNNGAGNTAFATEATSHQYISFMIDGDTDLSVKECVIVYVRILLDGLPTTILGGHVEVEYANADGRCLVQTGYYMNCNVFSVV
ncbi:zinc finger protein 862-like [Labeo rohita]|uniref:Zinc finger protein 862-like n=1 Tax=Labeo rohita TaxID=84645 RepID=A0A498MF65_LABRO|nr:zinc finger protein 862-like [Labeo rohita]